MSRSGGATACALWLALSACDGVVGTIELGLVTSPGDDSLARATRLRLTVGDPAAVIDAARAADGSFDLALELTAGGEITRVLVEALDARGAVVAVGQTPRLPIGPVDAAVAVFVAAPDSLGEAPARLPAPRSQLQAARLGFGALWAGGLDVAGDPAADLTIYNVYRHELQLGDPLPAPRAAMTAVAGQAGFAYLFGGTDTAGDARATFWRFDTGVSPRGAYVELGSDPTLARADAAAVPIGAELFLMTGAQPALLDGALGRAMAVDGPPADGSAVPLIADPPSALALVAGADVGSAGAVIYRDGVFEDRGDAPAALLRTGQSAVRLPNADALVVGGEDSSGLVRSAVIYRRAGDDFEVIADWLATPRRDAAVAVAGNRVVVAGGRDASGAPIADAEIFDTTTLDPIATVPLVVPRADAAAVALDNAQVLIVGGVDRDGVPTDVIELFTPELDAPVPAN